MVGVATGLALTRWFQMRSSGSLESLPL